jgi:hypothetical protein
MSGCHCELCGCADEIAKLRTDLNSLAERLLPRHDLAYSIGRDPGAPKDAFAHPSEQIARYPNFGLVVESRGRMYRVDWSSLQKVFEDYPAPRSVEMLQQTIGTASVEAQAATRDVGLLAAQQALFSRALTVVITELLENNLDDTYERSAKKARVRLQEELKTMGNESAARELLLRVSALEAIAAEKRNDVVKAMLERITLDEGEST